MNSFDAGAMTGLQSSDPGIIVVGRDRTILFKNQSAQSILGSDHALTERHNRLASREAALDLRLCAAIEQAGAARAPFMTAVPRCGGMPLFAVIVPLQDSEVEALGALLLVFDPQAVRLIPSAALVRMFGLTDAEAQTALATYEGQTPAEIAACRHRSIATIRTQLSRIFMKCGVKRQAQLVRLLAGIANMCSVADSIKTGMAIERSAQSASFKRAVQRNIRDGVSRRIVQTSGVETVARMHTFAPGQSTPRHYHMHGHEVLCVLGGRLTTDINATESWVTGAGEARYIGENIPHRGYNADAHEAVQVLSIDVRETGQDFRVEVESESPALP